MCANPAQKWQKLGTRGDAVPEPGKHHLSKRGHFASTSDPPKGKAISLLHLNPPWTGPCTPRPGKVPSDPTHPSPA